MSSEVTKCPYDPYAYYDAWGNRYLVFCQWDLWRIERQIALLTFLTYFSVDVV